MQVVLVDAAVDNAITEGEAGLFCQHLICTGCLDGRSRGRQLTEARRQRVITGASRVVVDCTGVDQRLHAFH